MVILVKVYEKETVDSSLYAPITVPVPTFEFTIEEEDRDTIFDSMSAYDPDKYMIIISYSQMSERGSQWMRFSSLFDALHTGTPSLDHVIGKA